MKTKLWILSLAFAMISACNFRGDSESDDKDTLNVSKSQDTLVQDRLDSLKTDTALSENPSSPDKADPQQ